MYFDSHAHLDDGRFNDDRAQIFAELAQHGVSGLMNIGCDGASSRASVALAGEYPFVYAAVGSHPDDADHVNGALLDEYRRLASHPKVRAIGEIGLDYHYEDVPRAQQIIAFEEQLDLAEALDLPVIVHMRDAWEDAYAIVERHPKARGVFHCFSGSAETAKWLCKRGWYLGFTGVVTFKNARTGGLLATFSKAADSKNVRVVMVLWAVVAIIAMLLIGGAAGMVAAVGGLLMFAFHRVFAYRQFGGITGDTAGWFLQLCELVCVAFAVLAQKIF